MPRPTKIGVRADFTTWFWALHKKIAHLRQWRGTALYQAVSRWWRENAWWGDVCRVQGGFGSCSLV